MCAPHECWSISIRNIYDGKIKLAHCSRHPQEVVTEKPKYILLTENFRKDGVIVIDMYGFEVTIDAAGRVMFFEEDYDEGWPALDDRGDPANIYSKIPICLCMGCQRMKHCCDNDYDVYKLLSLVTDVDTFLEQRFLRWIEE